LDGGIGDGCARAAVQVARAWLSSRGREGYIGVYRSFTGIAFGPVDPLLRSRRRV
jgi:hypothetical protein